MFLSVVDTDIGSASNWRPATCRVYTWIVPKLFFDSNISTHLCYLVDVGGRVGSLIKSRKKKKKWFVEWKCEQKISHRIEWKCQWWYIAACLMALHAFACCDRPRCILHIKRWLDLENGIGMHTCTVAKRFSKRLDEFFFHIASSTASSLEYSIFSGSVLKWKVAKHDDCWVRSPVIPTQFKIIKWKKSVTRNFSLFIFLLLARPRQQNRPQYSR